ncbi:primase-helicase family protein [Mesorhizobium sp. M0296]|uniref:primase-helicase family protein n=1 Tax=Mesorhizobium sp. M0296 TaxID=2956931 RepID=UPI003338DD43
MTKTYGVGEAGKPVATKLASISPGVAARIELAGSAKEVAEGFASTLESLTPRQAIVLAPPPAGQIEWRVVAADDAAGRPDVISKTNEHFKAPVGPAIIGLDFDVRDWPREVQERVQAADGHLSGVLSSVFPAMADAVFVMRASVSSGIENSETGPQLGERFGQHRYFFAAAGADAVRDENLFADRLHDRLVLGGWGYGFITKAGTVLIRSLIDRVATQSLSRIWYEADAVLDDARLRREPGARRPIVKNRDGGVLDTSLLAPLSEAEKTKLAIIEAAIRKGKEPEAAPVREAWRKARVEALIKRGVPADRATKVIHAAIERHELTDDFEIFLDDGRTVTIRDVLDYPTRFHELTCADPFEPEYGRGRNLAIIYSDGKPVTIYSHAHGGIQYFAKEAPRDWFDPNAFETADEPAPDSEIAAVNRLNAHHAVVLAGGRTIVVTEKKTAEGLQSDFGAVDTLRHWYANDVLRVAKKDRSVFDLWLQSPKRRQYDGIVFSPEGAPAGSYNLWRGFSVQADATASCALLLDHVRTNVCSGNADHFRWVIGFFAQMVQRPGDKPGVALVLRGGQGTGKSIVGQCVGSLFPAHHVVVSQPDHLTGRFNAHLERAILVQAEEAFWAGDRAAAGGALKDLITSDRMRIERKGIDAIEVRNNIRLLVTTNSRWAVPAGTDERRFAVFDVADHRKQDAGYFGSIVEQMKFGGRGALLHYLQTFDLSSVDLRVVPDTEALLDQKLASLPPFDRWWMTTLGRGELGYASDWPEEIDKKAAYAAYEKEAAKLGRVMSDAEFGKEMKRVCPSIDTKRIRVGTARAYVFVLPALEVCRQAFADLLRSPLDWNEL